MPFAQIIPRPLSPPMVQLYAPSSPGVYVISNAQEWLLIAESDNIRADLLAHLQDVGAALMKYLPTGFVFEVCDPHGRQTRKARLIQEYEPVCNRHRSRYPDR